MNHKNSPNLGVVHKRRHPKISIFTPLPPGPASSSVIATQPHLPSEQRMTSSWPDPPPPPPSNFHFSQIFVV